MKLLRMWHLFEAKLRKWRKRRNSLRQSCWSFKPRLGGSTSSLIMPFSVLIFSSSHFLFHTTQLYPIQFIPVFSQSPHLTLIHLLTHLPVSTTEYLLPFIFLSVHHHPPAPLIYQFLPLSLLFQRTVPGDR